MLFAAALSAQETPQLLPNFATMRSIVDLPEMQQRRVIRALVTYSKTDFFEFKGRLRGLQTEVLQQYEKFLNKDVKKRGLKTKIVYIPVTFDHLIPALLEGRGDIAAAILTITPEREKKVAFATGGKLKVDEVVVRRKGVKGLNSVENLSGRTVYVLRGSSYVEHLKGLNVRLKAEGKKPVNIQEADPNLVTEDILELVNAGIVEFTVSDDYKARLWSKVLPNIVVREDLKVHTGSTVGWAVRKNNPKLLKSLNKFFQKIKLGTLLGNVIFNRYYKDTRWIKNPLADEERQKLEQVILLFKQYGDRYGFNYLALVAQAYQESGLDHNKKSSAGAVGIMQLLLSTAADRNVGIPDIQKLENNIHAGAKYMSFLRKNYFTDPKISDEDRLAFTWAAYNAGPAKVRRIRERAKKMGLDPNKWFRNVEHAAMKIVGTETVRYVANIYKYYVAYSLKTEIRDKKAAKIKDLSK